MLVVTRMMMVVVGKERGLRSSSSSLMTQSDSAALRYLFVRRFSIEDNEDWLAENG